MSQATLNLLTSEEVAMRFRKSVKQVLRYVYSGKLRGKKLGREWRFPIESVAAFESARELNGGLAVPTAPQFIDRDQLRALVADEVAKQLAHLQSGNEAA